MDFHPLVTNATHSGIKIPYYSNRRFKYDPRQPFASYPSQKELSKFVHDIFRLEKLDTLSAIQSWLFFGLMEEIFGALGVTFSEADFILETRHVTVKAIPQYLWYCVANTKNQSMDETEKYVSFQDKEFGRKIDTNETQNRINSALEIACDTVEEILSRATLRKDLYPELDC